jgi:hypothetical protein
MKCLSYVSVQINSDLAVVILLSCFAVVEEARKMIMSRTGKS